MTIPSIGGVIGALAVAPLVRRFGKKRLLAFTLMGQAVGLIIWCSGTRAIRISTIYAGESAMEDPKNKNQTDKTSPSGDVFIT